MSYIFIVALEFLLAFSGVAMLIRYYNHKAQYAVRLSNFAYMTGLSPVITCFTTQIHSLSAFCRETLRLSQQVQNEISSFLAAMRFLPYLCIRKRKERVPTKVILFHKFVLVIDQQFSHCFWFQLVCKTIISGSQRLRARSGYLHSRSGSPEPSP